MLSGSNSRSLTNWFILSGDNALSNFVSLHSYFKVRPGKDRKTTLPNAGLLRRGMEEGEQRTENRQQTTDNRQQTTDNR